MKSVREVALELLEKVGTSQSYSNLALNQAIDSAQLSTTDVRLLTELVYGTLQNELLLDFSLRPFLGKKKLQPWVRILLRMSAYQMIQLDRIPDHAVIHEAVTIAKKRGHKGIAGLVNGVLRSAQRKGWPSVTEIEAMDERLSIVYSHPRWLVQRWIELWGEEATEQMLQQNNTPPASTARVNTTKVTREALLNTWNETASISPGVLAEEAVVIPGHIASLNAYEDGRLTIQDESSMLVAHALNLDRGLTVLDACAAPGGKTTHIAERMQDEGTIHALDLHRHKVRLIDQQAKRLQLTSIHARECDARQAEKLFAPESFQRILVDAPCTGFGVIRRKPEIKWSKSRADSQALARVQLDILSAVAPLLAPGGTIVYSTCTIEPEENQDVVTRFLQTHPEFLRDDTFKSRMPAALPEEAWTHEGDIQLLPHLAGTDGFYLTALRKKGS
ncbi:16S rRNA (cytosine(967)-C(5))-methyltransferase RsmB [Litoribacterium kuwaitense]|uniref:16S rRNA (cytosine(967)-C(5))-methyltransferase RsmB n=1 Tax=Litoribacterium kuwaitense TaxID=1398745 RepID=UPI001BA521C0